MKIALVTSDWPSFSGGGVASLSETMAIGLRAAGAQIEVWTRGGRPRSRTLGPRTDGLIVRGVAGRSWRRVGRKHWARAVEALVSDFRPDVLVVSPWDSLPGLLDGLPEGMRPPIWVVAHGRDITAELEPSRESLRREALAGPFRWLCLTEWMRENLLQRGVEPCRVSVIPAAVPEPASHARPAGDQGFRILTVGRLIDRKGHDVLLRALAELGDPHIHYSIVGEGPSRARLEALAHHLGVTGQVSFEGRLEGEAFEEAWARAHLFAMLPRCERGGDTEGYGLVFLEAAARGIPVLGAAADGAAEAVTQGVDCLQVQRPEDMAEVAEALRCLRDDPVLRARLGQAGRRRFENTGRPAHLASALLSTFNQGRETPLESPPEPQGGRWVVAVRAAMPSPRPQAWQAFQQAVGLAQSGLPEVVLVADAALPDGGPDALEDWLGHPLPKPLRVLVPARWHRPPLAGLLFRRSLRSLRSPGATLLCRDPRVAATEGRRWRRLLLEWHVRPNPEQPSHRRALEAADLRVWWCCRTLVGSALLVRCAELRQSGSPAPRLGRCSRWGCIVGLVWTRRWTPGGPRPTCLRSCSVAGTRGRSVRRPGRARLTPTLASAGGSASWGRFGGPSGRSSWIRWDSGFASTPVTRTALTVFARCRWPMPLAQVFPLWLAICLASGTS